MSRNLPSRDKTDKVQSSSEDSSRSGSESSVRPIEPDNFSHGEEAQGVSTPAWVNMIRKKDGKPQPWKAAWDQLGNKENKKFNEGTDVLLMYTGEDKVSSCPSSLAA